MRPSRDVRSWSFVFCVEWPFAAAQSARGGSLRFAPTKHRAWAAVALPLVALAHLVGCDRNPSSTAPAAPEASEARSDPSPLAVKDAGASSAAIPSASVQAVVNPDRLPAYDGPVGIIEGTVLVKGPPSPDLPGLSFQTCPAGVDTYGKLFRAGPPRADGLRPLADAVVVVTGYRGFYLPVKDDSVRVTISANCAYPARTIAITYGQRLEIANDSRFAFAPVLSGTYQPAIMIAPPGQNGDPVKFNPMRPGHYVLDDEMQQFVQEVVLVLPQPLHAVTDGRGYYRIEGVPVGTLKVGAQLDALGGAIPATEVDVRPNVVENVELVIPYEPDDGGATTRHRRLVP